MMKGINRTGSQRQQRRSEEGVDGYEGYMMSHAISQRDCLYLSDVSSTRSHQYAITGSLVASSFALVKNGTHTLGVCGSIAGTAFLNHCLRSLCFSCE